MIGTQIRGWIKSVHDSMGRTDIPTDIEFLGSEEKPERLFQHSSLHLDTCTGPCSDPFIEARLELRAAVIGQNLLTASSQSCRHDPVSIRRQQKFCGLNPSTNTNLLPNPEYDIVNQLIGPALGNPPRLIPSLLAWRFDTASSTVWEVDTNRLINHTKQSFSWDSDFTISFWLRRRNANNYLNKANIEDHEESIICSHDDIDDPKKSTMWIFDPLPEDICSQSTGHDDGIWHHYSITFSSSPSAVTNDPISILIDGQDLDIKAMPTDYESIQSASNPFKYQGKPR
ncbi:unnamed protein product [Trichobilharzia regenti]|nr:unnamed protein product [Trichobilharzia regenti]